MKGSPTEARLALAFLDGIECEPGRVTPHVLAAHLKHIRSVLADLVEREERLREALEKIANEGRLWRPGTPVRRLADIAREALATLSEERAKPNVEGGE